MNKLFRKLLFSVIFMFPSYAMAANVTYVFDTVTSVDLHSSLPKISGIEKDTGNPLDVSFVDNTNISFRFVVNRCVPIFLTAIEKPGRYYLYITVDSAERFIQLVGCKLEMK